MANRPITLTTDFPFKRPLHRGHEGGNTLYQLGGPHNGHCPSIRGAGYTRRRIRSSLGACGYFPQGTIHVAVIDPGVGGERAPVIIETERYIFVGPDNGIFSLVLKRRDNTDHPYNQQGLLPRGPVSRTFHGRDIFAPIAAHLSLGVEPLLSWARKKRRSRIYP